MSKGVHAALGAQVRIGTGLEVVIVTARCARRIEVTGWTWCVIAGGAVVKLTRWALALWTIAVTHGAIVAAWWTVCELFAAFAVTRWAVTHTVTVHMAVGARGTTAACGFGVAHALHHFTARGFGSCGHHVTAWGLA